MLPPIDDSVLQSNPEFASLYKTLTTMVLNQNGSTKNDPAAKTRDAVHEKLKPHRLKAAKQHLLIHALSTVAPPDQTSSTQPKRTTISSKKIAPEHPSSPSLQFPDPLVDLILLLPPLLTQPPSSLHLDPDSTSLLLTNPPLSDLPSLLPQLTPLLSHSLHASALSLARHTNPTTNPSFLHRHLPALAASISASSTTLSASKAALVAERHDASTRILTLLSSHAAALAHLSRALEAKHGAAARSLELRAAEVALEARRGEADAAGLLAAARRTVYTPEARVALAAYAAHLRDGRVRVAEVARARRAELAGYGVGVGVGVGVGSSSAGGDDDGEINEGRGDGGNAATKERTLREMARVFRDLGRQIADVKRDLERLGRA